MLREIDNFYLRQEESAKSCLLALREIILKFNEEITEAWKYRMPFFCYRGKMFCYVWIDKKTRQPYIGIVEGRKVFHPELIGGNRSRMKIMYVDPEKDLPIKTIRKILKMAMVFYN